jgi:hypothetical protein
VSEGGWDILMYFVRMAEEAEGGREGRREGGREGRGGMGKKRRDTHPTHSSQKSKTLLASRTRTGTQRQSRQDETNKREGGREGGREGRREG